MENAGKKRVAGEAIISGKEKALHQEELGVRAVKEIGFKREGKVACISSERGQASRNRCREGDGRRFS